MRTLAAERYIPATKQIEITVPEMKNMFHLAAGKSLKAAPVDAPKLT
jgi:hypothetical protein